MTILRSLFFLALPILLGACSDICDNTVISRTPSPDGKHDAVLFQRDCGATTGFSTQISLTSIGDAVVKGGNIFVADADHGTARAGDWGGPWAEAEWLSSDRLLIRHAAKSRIFENRQTLKGISIAYHSVP